MESPLAPSLGGNVPSDVGWCDTAHFDPAKTGKSYLKTPTGTVVISEHPHSKSLFLFLQRGRWVWGRGMREKGKTERDQEEEWYAEKEEEKWMVSLSPFLFKSASNIETCSWFSKQGPTKSLICRGVLFLRIEIVCLFYTHHIINVTRDQFYLFSITYFQYIFYLWI